jgi:adenylylsulfate kinase-like enzyme
VCNLLTRNDVVAIAAAIAPYRGVRAENRKLIGSYVEIYCKCPLKVLKERDPKGLYEKAERGEIKGFTGIDDPYEEPTDPEILVETDKESVDQSLSKIVKTLEILNYIPPSGLEDEYTEEEEEKIKERLRSLGYI